MAFDFPAAPGIGTIYAPVGGPTYLWDGEKWRIVGDDTLYARKTAEARNRLINPAMQISQENGDTVSPTAGSLAWYVADQWQGFCSATAPATVNFARSGANLIDGTSYKFARANVVAATFPIGVGDYLTFSHILEGNQVDDLMWGTPDAKQIVVRFMARSTLNGRACLALRNFGTTRSYVADFMLTSNVWKAVELVIPGDTVAPAWGPAINAVGMYLNISFALGTNNHGVLGWQSGSKLGVSGMQNPLQTTNAQVCIGMAGLYADPDLTGIAPPFEVPVFSDELRRCHRYWQKWYGIVIETSGLAASLIGPATMRATPTVSGGGAGFAAPINNMAMPVPSIQPYQTARAYADLTLNARM